MFQITYLISKYTVDPISGGTGLRVNFVRLTIDDEPLFSTVEINFTGVASDKISGINHNNSPKRTFNRVIKKKQSAIKEGC